MLREYFEEKTESHYTDEEDAYLAIGIGVSLVLAIVGVLLFSIRYAFLGNENAILLLAFVGLLIAAGIACYITYYGLIYFGMTVIKAEDAVRGWLDD